MDYVHRTNLIPDPRFQHVDRLKSSGVTVGAVNHENGRRYVRAMYDGVGTDPYLNIANDIITVPGSYRLFYNVFAQGGDGKLNIYTREPSKPNNYVLAYSMSVGNGQTIRQASNQLTLNAVTIVRIIPPKTSGGLIMITECNLERASTFDEAFPYFDWSTMPRETGGGVFVLALSLLLSAALSGGWRHEDSESASKRRMPAEGERVGSGLRCDCGAGRGRLVDVPVPGPVQGFRAVRLAGRRDDGPRRVLLLSTRRTLVGVFPFGEHYLGCQRAGLVRRDHEARREQKRLHARGFERQTLGERDLFAAGLGEGQGHVRCRRPADAMVLGRHDAAAAELDAHGLGVVA